MRKRIVRKLLVILIISAITTAFNFVPASAESDLLPSCPPPLQHNGETIWETGTVKEVVDGDTAIVATCKGDLIIRFIGVQAPESFKSKPYTYPQCGSRQATALIKNLIPIGAEVELRSMHEGSSNKYGILPRSYRSIYAKDMQGNFTIDIQRALVDAGLAMWFPNAYESFRNKEYLEAIEVAISKKVGLWSKKLCRRENTEEDNLEIWVNTDSKLPGENPFGEYVQIYNNSKSEVDLSDWVLRDTSLALYDRKYWLPKVTILPSYEVLTVYLGAVPPGYQLGKNEISLGLTRAILHNPSNQTDTATVFNGDGVYLLSPIIIAGGGNMRAWSHDPCLKSDCSIPSWVVRPQTLDQILIAGTSLRSEVSSLFARYAASPSLANPGLVLMDPKTSEVLYGNLEKSPRTPASVLKLVSTFSALHFLEPDTKMQTAIYSTKTKNKYVLMGELDPWLSSNVNLSKKNGQPFLPTLITEANVKKSRSITIEYFGLYETDLKNLVKYLRTQRITLKYKKISKEVAQNQVSEEISHLNSAPVAKMVEFALLWSDNTLANRLGKAAARSLGESTKGPGLQRTFTAALNTLDINTEELQIEDGSGLSHENRISAITLAQLLIKTRGIARYSALYDGLPIAGKTGTLKKRFIETAPNAVGLARAKTGFLSGTVSLAGYVTSGDQEYVLVVIADRITPTLTSRKKAREIMDKMIGTLTKVGPAVGLADPYDNANASDQDGAA